MMSKNLNDIAIPNIHSADYCCIFSGISKKEVGKFTSKYRFDWKKWNIIKRENLFPHKKRFGKEVLTFGNTDIEKHKFYRYKSSIFQKM